MRRHMRQSSWIATLISIALEAPAYFCLKHQIVMADVYVEREGKRSRSLPQECVLKRSSQVLLSQRRWVDGIIHFRACSEHEDPISREPYIKTIRSQQSYIVLDISTIPQLTGDG